MNVYQMSGALVKRIGHKIGVHLLDNCGVILYEEVLGFLRDADVYEPSTQIEKLITVLPEGLAQAVGTAAAREAVELRNVLGRMHDAQQAAAEAMTLRWGE